MIILKWIITLLAVLTSPVWMPIAVFGFSVSIVGFHHNLWDTLDDDDWDTDYV